jgi:hypothetical protein
MAGIKDVSQLSDEEIISQLKAANVVGYAEPSVLSTTPTSFADIAKNTVESLAKGSAKGIVDLIGGWESLYNYLKADKNPEAAKPARILKGIKDLTGINLETAPYRTPYNVGAAGAPAAAATMMGVPGLFNLPKAASIGQRVGAGAGEFATAGSLGAAAPLITESPLGQMAIQGTPYVAKGAFVSGRDVVRQPVGAFPSEAETRGLLGVGPMTPGELTGSRQQLATEARIASSPRAENVPLFKQTQAESVQDYLTNIFQRASKDTLSPEQLTNSVVSSFNNYGKSLSTKLRSDANKDFKAATGAGGTVNTQPIVDAANASLGKIPPETPGFESIKASVGRIIDEYAIPAVPEQVTPSSIVTEAGAPAAVSVTPATPAQARSIDIDRLQKNLSAWGEAAWSGTADFGKGNIFDGVAPGQAKGIARAVLGGFKQSLDQAIDAGVPGAEQLKKARDKFSANLDAINVYAERPLVEYFDKMPTQLVPEDVVTKLKNAKPSQRAILVDVLENNPDAAAVLDTVRKSVFDDVLTKSRITGAATNQPDFNVGVALSELSKKDNDFDFLFKTKQDKNDTLLAMNYMKRVLQSEAANAPTGLAGGVAYGVTKAAGGTTQLANANKSLFDALRDVVNNPVSFAQVIFDPNAKDALVSLAKGKTTVDKINNATEKLGNVLGIAAVRGIPMATPEKAPAEAVNAQTEGNVSVQSLTDEQLMDLLKQAQ